MARHWRRIAATLGGSRRSARSLGRPGACSRIGACRAARVRHRCRPRRAAGARRDRESRASADARGGGSMKRIALLGCGVVGSRVAEMLDREREHLAERLGEPIELSVVLVRDLARNRGLSRARLTSCLRDAVDDPGLDAAIEVLGGVQPAFEILERLLRRGVPVVTANKSVLSQRWNELHAASAESGAALRFEASVGGAMPIVRTLRSLGADRIDRVRAVLNGSCNFVLNRVVGDGMEFRDAIDEARRRGLLEPDPSADLSG
ncbi:MAG: hypothetical protein FJ253_12510, partial [Phycisphaerae bacterium]|nr:hypothetical protein [Phycisphaerae bacterium]